MSDIKMYIGGERQSNFIPISMLPRLSQNMTIGDALGEMQNRGIRISLIEEPRKLRVMSSDDIMVYCKNTVGCSESEPIYKVASEIDEIELMDQSQPTEKLTQSLRGNKYVAIVEEDRIIGLMVPGKVERIYGTIPDTYECERGHLYYPPPPEYCPIDGTPIRPR